MFFKVINILESYLIETYEKLKKNPLWALLLTLGLSFGSQPVKAQNETDSLLSQHTIVPLVFFLPETSLGFGVTGISTFQRSNHSENTRPSQVLYSAVYTLKNQLLLFIPFEFYGNSNASRIKGELGYYQYFYNYHGIGAESSKNDLENYSVNFPRIEANYSKRLGSNIYLGAGFNFDEFDIIKTESEGLLETEKPYGYQGGTKANFVAIAFFDNRDTLFAPNSGHYFEVKFQHSMPQGISDFVYSKIDIDYRIYNKLYKKTILASNLYWSKASSQTPFFDLPYISTPNRARGYDDRRFLNPEILNLQTELRFPIYKRFSAASFISATAIPKSNFAIFDKTPELSYGLGFRYELRKESKARLRLDIAKSRDSFNFYFTVNEAF